MKVIILILMFSLSSYILAEIQSEKSEILERFLEFQKEYNKTYSSTEEFMKKFKIFEENLFVAEKYDKNSDNSKHGVTFFSDLSFEEFQNSFLKLNLVNKEEFQTNSLKIPKKFLDSKLIFLPNQPSSSFSAAIPPPPSSKFTFDWRDRNLNDDVESQGKCYSCWAFVTASNIEAQYFLKYGKKIRLSEQQLVDCDTGNSGCRGGLMTKAYEYVSKQGLMLDEEYPYVDGKKECLYIKDKTKVFVEGYISFDQDPRIIAQGLLDYGPLSAGINGNALQFYRGGIIDDEFCDDKLTHAVLIVGYGTDENGIDYWILKNEWGNKWGEGGYFRLKRSEGKGICGINTYVSTAVLKEEEFLIQ